MGLDWYFKKVLEAKIAESAENNFDNSSDTPFFALRGEELKQNIEELQKHNPNAEALVCAAFEPLIRSLVFSRRVAEGLEEEDAYQIAFKAFWELVSTYQGDDFEHLPGLIKKTISDALGRALHKSFRIADNEELVLDGEDGTEVVANDSYGQKIFQLALEQGLSKLPKNQRAILEKRYYQRETQKQVASSLKRSDRWIRKQESEALDTLNGILS